MTSCKMVGATTKVSGHCSRNNRMDSCYIITRRGVRIRTRIVSLMRKKNTNKEIKLIIIIVIIVLRIEMENKTILLYDDHYTYFVL